LYSESFRFLADALPSPYGWPEEKLINDRFGYIKTQIYTTVRVHFLQREDAMVGST
jgi:hypothetical protein